MNIGAGSIAVRGDFSRQLRNRGMGLCVRRSTIWSEMPNVTLELRCEGGETVTTYHTPVGSVSTRTRGHTGRISDGMSVEVKGMIERVEDFGPVIFMLDDTVFHRDDSVYWDAVRDVGVDGIVRDTALDMESTPYGATRRYFGDYFGLERWVFEQHDHPNEFVALLEAQIRRDERRLELAGDSPADLLAFGWLGVMLLIGIFLRAKIPFIQRFLFPSCLLGGLLAWVCRLPPLLAVSEQELPSVERKATVRDQYLLAAEIATEEAWKSVAREFPPEANEQNQYYALRAQQRLAELYLQNDDLDQALRCYEHLAGAETADPQFCAVGLSGQANVYILRDEHSLAHQKLAAFVQLLDRLPAEVRQVILTELHPRLRPELERLRRDLNAAPASRPATGSRPTPATRIDP